MATPSPPLTCPSNYQPVTNWRQLFCAEEVIVHRHDHTMTTGRVDMVALEGSVFWIIEDGSRGRTMIHRKDDLMVYRRSGPA